MPFRITFALLLVTSAARGQDVAEFLDALSRIASNFAVTAPGLTADEVLEQRGRRGFLEVLKGTQNAPRQIDIHLQEGFRTHRVLSNYGLTESVPGKVLHEIRNVTSFDGRPVAEPVEARHALSSGMRGDEDRTRKIFLENFEQEQLEGAVTDFGQLILLFAERYQKNYTFAVSAPQTLSYRQVTGTHGLTIFQGGSAEREATEGEILFSEPDLIPQRITLNTRRQVSKKDVVRTVASVEYMPGPFGLVPVKITHQQFLNDSLLVENILHHENFQRLGVPEMIP